MEDLAHGPIIGSIANINFIEIKNPFHSRNKIFEFSNPVNGIFIHFSVMKSQNTRLVNFPKKKIGNFFEILQEKYFEIS